MLTTQEILELLREALKIALIDEPEQGDGYAASAPLGGREGLLDSYAMLRFLVEVDYLLGEKTGRDVVLINDSALRRENSPFSTLESMAAYIGEYLQGCGDA